MTAATVIDLSHVGIFDAWYMGKTHNGSRWGCLNRVTNIIHYTYGSWDEVEAMLSQQTEAWKRRGLPKAAGAAWRGGDFRTNKTKAKSKK